MELITQHIDFIQKDLQKRGLVMDELSDSVLDHICCAMEADDAKDFDLLYEKVLQSFGDNGILKIQQNTILLLTFKKEITMQRTMYLLGFIATILSTTGLLFKLLHWPGAAIILVLGIALLNFGFLPMYFYDKYKKAAA